jgi:hypothetical protein
MRFVAPLMMWPLEHPQKRFVKQSCRLQSVISTLVPQIFRSEAA